MKNRPVSFLRSVNRLVQPELNPHDNVVDSYCRRLQESHIRLGMLASEECYSDKINEWIREAMYVMADLYYYLDAIREEVAEVYYKSPDGTADEDRG